MARLGARRGATPTSEIIPNRKRTSAGEEESDSASLRSESASLSRGVAERARRCRSIHGCSGDGLESRRMTRGQGAVDVPC